MEWVNWSGSQRARPAVLARPLTRRELAAAVVAGPAPVRVAGAGHSFSPAAVSDGTLISLDGLRHVLDADGHRVRVEAGIRLRDLSRELHARGLAMPNLGDVDAQSLAGALATGTHGTGVRLPNLSAQVERVELVGARRRRARDRRRRRAARRPGRAGRARRGHRGHAPLRARVPAPPRRPARAARAAARRAARAGGRARPLRALDVPARGRRPDALVRPHGRAAARPRRRARVRERRPGRQPRAARAQRDRAAAPARDPVPEPVRVGRRVPPRARRLVLPDLRLGAARALRGDGVQRPREQAAPALHAAREVLARHPVAFPIELRFGAGDDALLSPAHGRDSAFVAVHVFNRMAYEPAFREVEAALLALGGRPHWGKRSFLSHVELAPRYPSWEDFLAVRDALDPDRRFANPWLRDVLGP